MTHKTIKPDQVLDKTLEQLIGANENGMKSYIDTKNLVQAVLFSSYPKRRAYARLRLNEMWRCDVGIETVSDGEIVYAYMNLNKSPKYILVGRYKENDPTYESLPSEKEMKDWPKE